MTRTRRRAVALLATIGALLAAPAGPVEAQTEPEPTEAELQAELQEAVQPMAATATLPDGLCYGETFPDPDEPQDPWLDASEYALGFECNSSTWILDVTTFDEWVPSDLGIVEIRMDTSGSLQDGCFGAEFIAYMYWDTGVDQLVGGLFRMNAACEVTAQWTLFYALPAPNEVALLFDGGPLRNASTLRWGARIHRILDDPSEQEVFDFMPDGSFQGGNVHTAPANPCAGACFYLTNRTTGGAADVFFRDTQPATHYLVGDWNRDGVDTIGFRNGDNYVLKNAHSPSGPSVTFNYGQPSDSVLVGDWNGDGIDTLAVRRGNQYFLSNRLGGGNADVVFSYGRGDDVVLVGDWDGDGDDTLAVRRGNQYFLSNRLGGGNADVVFSYGRGDDVVLVGDWDGDRDSTLAVRRGNQYFLSNRLAGGAADVVFSFGTATDTTFTGDWNADRRDSLGVRR